MCSENILGKRDSSSSISRDRGSQQGMHSQAKRPMLPATDELQKRKFLWPLWTRNQAEIELPGKQKHWGKDLQDPAVPESRSAQGDCCGMGQCKGLGEGLCVSWDRRRDTCGRHSSSGRGEGGFILSSWFGQMGSVEERLGRKAGNLSGILLAQPTEAAECVTPLLTSFHNVPCMLCVASK